MPEPWQSGSVEAVLKTGEGLAQLPACPPTLLSLISEPNDESGANVDASKMWREDREQFNKIAKQIVQKSLGL